MEREQGRRIFLASVRSLTHAREFFADYVVEAVNIWLQRSPEGNVAHELSWTMTQDRPNYQDGPDYQDIHRAIARCRYNPVQ